MNRRSRIILAAALAIGSLFSFQNLAATAAGAEYDFHVHPAGSDKWSGRFAEVNGDKTDGPFRTLARARDAVRALREKDKLDRPVRVAVHAGRYELTEPFVLSPADSGTEASPTIYEGVGDKPTVLSGGSLVSDLKLDGGRWSAKLPESFAEVKPRQISVNGAWRGQSRLPAEGTYTIAGLAGADARARYNTPANRFEYAEGQIDPKWHNLTDVEAVVLHFWVDTHLPIQSVDAEKRIATFDRFSKRRFTEDHGTPTARYYLSNVREALTPGTFYFDRAECTLTYVPTADEGTKQPEVVVPRLTAVVELRGEPKAGKFVEHVQLRNLQLSETIWNPQPGDAVDLQAASQVSGAVVLTGARHCTVEDCTVQNVGGYGIELRDGCRSVKLAGNAIEWTGAGGIKISGGAAKSAENLRTSNNEVVDNRLLHLGRTWHSGVGILVQHAAGNRIAHNEIGDLYYTGISCGWVWGYAESVSRDNVIEFNHIHHVGQKLLSDMGGVYLLGVSPGTVVRNNLIHDIAAYGYGGWGLYTDEGSSEIVLENNVVYNTTDAGFHQHYGRENVIRNNVFAFGRDEQLARSRMEPHLSFTLERNIVYYREGEALAKNWSDDKFALDFNVYWNVAGPVTFPGGKTLDEWQQRGFDKHSIVADPKFVNPEQGDFSLQSDSPALKLGIKSIDVSRVGPRKVVRE